jgi:hypothetical protein
VYTDDERRLEALQRLNRRHAALLERRHELEKRAQKSEEQLRQVRLAHCVSHCVSLTVSPTVSLSLCLPLCLAHCVSHCVSLTVSPTVSRSLCLPLCLSHCVYHCVPHCVASLQAHAGVAQAGAALKAVRVRGEEKLTAAAALQRLQQLEAQVC